MAVSREMIKEYLTSPILSNGAVDGECAQVIIDVPRHFGSPGLFSPSLDAHYL